MNFRFSRRDQKCKNNRATILPKQKPERSGTNFAIDWMTETIREDLSILRSIVVNNHSDIRASLTAIMLEVTKNNSAQHSLKSFESTSKNWKYLSFSRSSVLRRGGVGFIGNSSNVKSMFRHTGSRESMPGVFKEVTKTALRQRQTRVVVEAFNHRSEMFASFFEATRTKFKYSKHVSPKVTCVLPSEGPAAGGITITIFGSGFGQASHSLSNRSQSDGTFSFMRLNEALQQSSTVNSTGSKSPELSEDRGKKTIHFGTLDVLVGGELCSNVAILADDVLTATLPSSCVKGSVDVVVSKRYKIPPSE